MEAINRVGQFAISLLDDNTIKIKKARSNHKNTDFTKPLILIDNLGNAQRQGSSDDFDGDNEVMTYADYYKQTFTFDFYGTGAYDLATRFIALLRSQKSFDLQQTSNLTFYRTSTITNLKQLTGSTYFERYQIEVVVGYWDNVDIATLRIDEAQIDLTYVEQ